MSTPDLTGVVDRILELARSRPPTLGGSRLVCVDGPAGSGKTTLAGALAERSGPAGGLVHLDDLYQGWSGLPLAPGQIADLLGPLARGRASSYRRWDWVADGPAEQVAVPVGELLVVEGVGAGSAPPGLTTVLVWVEAPPELRLRRGLERDGEAAAPHWAAWSVEEQAHFTAYRTRERADLHVDGTAGMPTGRDGRLR